MTIPVSQNADHQRPIEASTGDPETSLCPSTTLFHGCRLLRSCEADGLLRRKVAHPQHELSTLPRHTAEGAASPWAGSRANHQSSRHCDWVAPTGPAMGADEPRTSRKSNSDACFGGHPGAPGVARGIVGAESWWHSLPWCRAAFEGLGTFRTNLAWLLVASRS
jgi:hypothetical protein